MSDSDEMRTATLILTLTLTRTRPGSPSKAVEMPPLSSVSENMSFGAAGFSGAGSSSFNTQYENPMSKTTPDGLKKGMEAQKMIEKDLKKEIESLRKDLKEKESLVTSLKS